MKYKKTYDNIHNDDKIIFDAHTNILIHIAFRGVNTKWFFQPLYAIALRTLLRISFNFSDNHGNRD